MMCSRTLLLRIGILLTLASGASPGSAAPIFALELGFGDVQLNSATPVSDSLGFHSAFEGTNFYSRDAFASAEPGRLRSSSSASIQLTPAVTLGLGTVLNGTDAAAAFRLDDVIISGPGTGFLPTSLNMNLSGGLNATTFAQLGTGNGAEANASASVSIGVSIAGTLFRGTQSISSLWNVDTQSGGGSTFEDGLLTGYTGAQTALATPTVMVPIGSSFVVVLNLSTTVDTNTSNTILGARRQADASSDFDSTFSFALSGPVFDLPDGYTANSASGLIVDNRWLGIGAPSAVPEPSSLLLVMAGLLGFVRRLKVR